MRFLENWTHTDWIQAVQAIAATMVAALALFQDKIRAWFTTPEATIRLVGKFGEFIPTTGDGKALYYHLLIENKNPSYPLDSAEVVCVAYSRFFDDGRFIMRPIMPLKLNWPNQDAIASIDPAFGKRVTIVRRHHCDLGFLVPKSSAFNLSFEFGSTAFDGRVLPNERIRIALEVRAKNFQSRTPTCFEISWDGKWVDDLTMMGRHLRIYPVDWDPSWLEEAPDMFKTFPR